MNWSVTGAVQTQAQIEAMTRLQMALVCLHSSKEACLDLHGPRYPHALTWPSPLKLRLPCCVVHWPIGQWLAGTCILQQHCTCTLPWNLETSQKRCELI